MHRKNQTARIGEGQNNNTLQKKTWLNKDGNLKSDPEITMLGKSWPQETWDRYLDETLGSLDNDELVFFPYMDTETMREGKKILDEIRERGDYPSLRFAFKVALDELSKSERAVIKGCFWEGQDTPQIASQLKKSCANVRMIKTRALRKIREILPSSRFRKKLQVIRTIQQELESLANVDIPREEAL